MCLETCRKSVCCQLRHPQGFYDTGKGHLNLHEVLNQLFGDTANKTCCSSIKVQQPHLHFMFCISQFSFWNFIWTIFSEGGWDTREKIKVHIFFLQKVDDIFCSMFLSQKKTKIMNPLYPYVFSVNLLWTDHQKVIRHQLLIWGRGLEVVKENHPQFFQRH